jgi:hypothetical protein
MSASDPKRTSGSYTLQNYCLEPINFTGKPLSLPPVLPGFIAIRGQ